MGLDVKLFDGDVPPDLICGVCKKVLVNPVRNSCQHLFCSTCLMQHFRTDKSHACPACGAQLRAKSEPPSMEVSLRLLDLNIRCSQSCGKVLKMGELPDHVTEECPHTPVPCVHVRLGCRMKVRRREVDEHAEECDCRPVVCEACGKHTVYRDLFTHQSRTRCLEKKLRQQVTLAIKAANADVIHHRNYLQRQHSIMEQQERRRSLLHHGATPSSRNRSTGENSPLRPTATSTSGPRLPSGGAEFVSPQVGVTEAESVAWKHHALPLSKADTQVRKCKKCRRLFRVDVNSPTACRWHPGVRTLSLCVFPPRPAPHHMFFPTAGPHYIGFLTCAPHMLTPTWGGPKHSLPEVQMVDPILLLRLTPFTGKPSMLFLQYHPHSFSSKTLSHRLPSTLIMR